MTHGINKVNLTETDIITKLILPVVKSAGWDDMTQIRQEVRLKDGKVVVRGKLQRAKKLKQPTLCCIIKRECR